jgi:hypothetical protein
MRDMSDVEKHAFFDYMGFDKQERHEFFERLGIKHQKNWSRKEPNRFYPNVLRSYSSN